MKTTFKKIKEKNPCKDGWVKLTAYYMPKDFEQEISIEQIIKSNGIKDACLALRCIDGKEMNNVRLFCADIAESVLHIFEEKFPKDDRPRKAIEAIRLFVKGRISVDDLIAASYAAEAAYAAAVAAANAASYAAAASYTAAAPYTAAAAAANAAAAATANADSYADAVAAEAADADSYADAVADEAAAANAAAAAASYAYVDARRNKWEEIEKLLRKYLKWEEKINNLKN